MGRLLHGLMLLFADGTSPFSVIHDSEITNNDLVKNLR